MMTSGGHASDSRQPSPPSFAVQRHRPDAGACVLAFTGELDLESAPRFKAELEESPGEGCHKIVLDLSGVTFIDSTALGVLVKTNYERRLMAGEGLVIAGLRPGVLKVFEVTGLVGSFDITPSVDSALSSARGTRFERSL